MRIDELKINVTDTAAFREFLERVESFINEYAWHHRECAAVDADGEWRKGNPHCDCGYDEDIARLVPGEPT